jgi:hypothetical protein
MICLRTVIKLTLRTCVRIVASALRTPALLLYVFALCDIKQGKHFSKKKVMTTSKYQMPWLIDTIHADTDPTSVIN